MSDVTRKDVIELLLPVSGVGQATAEAVADTVGTDLDRLLSASEQELEQVDGVGTTTARAIRKRLQFLDRHGVHTPVEALEHAERRKNIPTDQLSQLVDLSGDGKPDAALYPRDPELDPQLVWRGKDRLDGDDLSVPVVPVYIQEKIVPQAIVENLRETAEGDAEEPELSLFDDFDGLSENALFDFYEHDANWSNRMILGDALVAMTSLAEKENLKGEVQTIYLDPPYGIKFQSNWQVSTRDNQVSNSTDITRQPEQVRAFRDTWKDGIHSYLTYLRDRIQVAHTLLNETGSIFVQIGDENLHTVRSLLDEVFGPDNFVSVITITKTTGAASKHLANVSDYVIWYARDKERMKYRQLYLEKELGGEGASRYNKVLLSDGTVRSATKAERAGIEPLPEGARAFTQSDLTNQRPARGADLWEYEYDGEVYTPGSGKWKTTKEGMDRLAAAGRIYSTGNTLRYIRFLDDFGAMALNNVWTDVGGIQSRLDPKVYVVQTATKIVKRCILMTSDPGDLVLDPTCGAGTTAYVAETWGRRWITIDTSRVALALARARLMGAEYPYWVLVDTPEGAKIEAEEMGRAPVEPEGGFEDDLRKGFVYKRALHVTLGTIANCEEIEPDMTRKKAESAIRRCADSELLYDQPHEDKRRVRVTGPFTVESLSPHRKLDADTTVSIRKDGEEDVGMGEPEVTTSADQDFGDTVIENLKRAGVQNGYRDERLKFETLEPYADGSWIAATGSYQEEDGEERIVAVSIGPEHGTVGREQVNRAALNGARIGADLVLVCGFAFDGGATEEAADATEREFPVVGDRQLGRVRVLNVRINADLMMDEELKSTGSGNLFMVFGEPDIDLEMTDENEVIVRLQGVDVYDPVKNEVRSSNPTEAMAWFIDTDYDESQFFVRHAYFTGDPEEYDPYAQLKRALDAEIDHEAWGRLHSTESLPFPKPSTGKIAVKVINHYGDEVLKVFSVD